MRKWILASLVALAAGRVMAAPPECKLIRIEEWPVRIERNMPIIDGEINGNKVAILIDTGSQRSFVTRSAVARMMLTRTNVGTTGLESVRLEELRIGPAKRKQWNVLVSPEQDFGTQVVSLILGYDFFATVDFEFDLANRAIRLFQARDCAGSPLAYWTDAKPVEAQLQGSGEILVSVAVNGRPTLAVLDSGASVSALTMAESVRLGINAKTAGVVTAGCSIGIGRPSLDYWSAPFESFALGNEVIRNPTLRIADFTRETSVAQVGGGQANRFAAQPQMILGMDFLRAHRIFVSNSQRKLYFTYAGGTVFPTGSDKTCHDLR
jgi:predicted aspartyl protease